MTKRRTTDEELELRYTTHRSKPSLRQLAKWAPEVSLAHITDLSSENDWPAKREAFWSTACEIAREQALPTAADRLVKIDALGADVAIKILERCQEFLDHNKLKPAQVRQIAATLNDALKAGHLATGGATEITFDLDRELDALTGTEDEPGEIERAM